MNPLAWIGAAAGIFMAGYLAGHVAASNGAERAALRARVAVTEANAVDAAQLRAENEAIRKSANDLEASLHARPDNRCRLVDSELSRLRAIIERRPARAR